MATEKAVDDILRAPEWAVPISWAQSYVIDGYRFVVDIDLAKFFDREEIGDSL
jgi:hypothetical protein